MSDSVKLPLNRQEKIYATLIYIVGPLVSILDILTIWSSASLSMHFLNDGNQNQTDGFLSVLSLSKESILAIFVTFFLLRTFVRLSRVSIEANLRKILSERLTNRIFEAQIIKHSKVDSNDNDSSGMLRDIDSVSEFLNCFIFSRFIMFEEYLLIAGIILAISVNSTIGGLVILVFSGLLLFLALRISSEQMKQSGYENAISRKRRIQFAQFTYSSIKELIAYGMNKPAVKFFDAQLKDSLKAEHRYQVISQSSSLVIEAIIVVSAVLTIWVTSVVLDSGAKNLSAAVVLALSAFRIIPCVSRLNSAFQSRKFTKYQSQILMGYLNNPSISNLMIGTIDGEVPALEITGSSYEQMNGLVDLTIELRNVTFAYSAKGPQVIKNLNHDFQTGLLHVVRGDSGKGKSTLLNLILGSAEIHEGQILINQVPLRSSQIFREYRIAYVPQRPTAIDYSLSDNITLAFLDNEVVDESRLQYAVLAAGLDKFIETLPEGLSTTVGEFGSKISGGQLQRIALARALYRKSCVLLLDEATSSLDYETETKILKDLVNLKDQVLIILVSHSNNVAQYADKILEL